MHQMIQRKKNGDFVYYTCDAVTTPHLFTTKFGGVSTGHLFSLNLGFNRGDERENVLRNYQILAEHFGVARERMTMTKQIHSDIVRVVDEKTLGMGLGQPMSWKADAIVTNLTNVPLCGYYADCVVTLLHDPVSRSIGVCHSGWRGTAHGILAKTVQAMRENYGADPKNIQAVIGPSIRQCCFETDTDVPDAMRETMGAMVEPFIQWREPKYFIDLQGINQLQLEQAGVETIIDSGLCTKCMQDEFWSHRATHGMRGVQAGVIMLEEKKK
ncbi:MAG: peptidoglycan editing factor PgeF [Eubacteriales bacterium]|nr:peptidoglycan editing factor PgeF [Eubacteriales bacterium]